LQTSPIRGVGLKFCTREKLPVKTFSYWCRKYKKGKGLSVEGNKEVALNIFKST